MTGPLSNLRVLELADEKGQFCGKLMADLGADVIKVEPPGGETARSVGPFLDDIPDPNRSLSFWHYTPPSAASRSTSNRTRAEVCSCAWHRRGRGPGDIRGPGAWRPWISDTRR